MPDASHHPSPHNRPSNVPPTPRQHVQEQRQQASSRPPNCTTFLQDALPHPRSASTPRISASRPAVR